jgi:DNA/RNA endonuclease G (NUC1)
MKYLVAALACLISCSLISQENRNDTLIHLKNYSVVYSKKYLQPVEVWYEVQCPSNSRKSEDCNYGFTKTIGDSIGIKTSNDQHYNKIWEKGHMAARASLACSCDDVEETFTFLNCALQHNKLNGGLWLKLEKKERKEAENNTVSVHIKVKFNDKTHFPGDVLRPSGFYKTLIINGDSTNYYFRNSFYQRKKLEHCIIENKFQN